jgi:hypothetical protein
MQKKISYFFIKSAGIVLLLTATAKLISGAGSAHILQTADPLLGISFRNLFWMLGVAEFAVALICILSNHVGLQAGLIAWLGTDFVVYRIGLLLINVQKPCPCLGNLTDALHISPQTGDTAMKIILAYLLIGSYATLFWLWNENRKTRIAAPASQEATPKSVS